jgi:hypothetical protein
MTIESADLSATTKQHFDPRPAALALDVDRYIDTLSDLELTDDQKAELLTVLWGIMKTFVELGVSSDLGARMLQEAGLIPAPTSDEEGIE